MLSPTDFPRRRVVARPLVPEPRLLVLEEKHGKRYFHVPNEAALFKLALGLLKERHKAGYWYCKPDPKDKPEPPDVTAEEIEKLPKSLQNSARTSLRNYTAALRSYEDEVNDYTAIVKAVREKDGQAAWTLLFDRRDYEYEGVRLERYNEVGDGD